MSELQTEPNTEAGDYIEDDPAAWVSWLATVRRYGPEFQKLAAHLGTEDAAAEVLASTVLSVLADQHGLYLCRENAYDAATPTVNFRSGQSGIPEEKVK